MFWEVVQGLKGRVVCLDVVSPAPGAWVVDDEAVFGQVVAPEDVFGREVLRPREDEPQWELVLRHLEWGTRLYLSGSGMQ